MFLGTALDLAVFKICQLLQIRYFRKTMITEKHVYKTRLIRFLQNLDTTCMLIIFSSESGHGSHCTGESLEADQDFQCQRR